MLRFRKIIVHMKTMIIVPDLLSVCIDVMATAASPCGVKGEMNCRYHRRVD